jgi:N-acetylglucosaminyl-diphospho-decaprenol L-rhamnosyltransferase
VTGPRIGVITPAHGRHAHLLAQQDGLAASTRAADVRCVVAIDDDAIADLLPGDVDVLSCPRGSGALPLARARNAGAEHVLSRGCDLLVFLDVDCIPAPALIERYAEANAEVGKPALLAGPVTYLPPSPTGYRLADLPELRGPHPARPDPEAGTVVVADDHDLFWSLSFAMSRTTWRRIGGFCEDYVGYGGEDTDFAATAAARGVPLYWVGGADAYHQHHAVSDPPVEHLEAIVANARIFRRRWGRWPMAGWLDEFEGRDMIARHGDRIEVTLGDR